MATAPFVDFYKTLAISPKATAGQIKSAFFRLAKSCHPDVSGDRSTDVKFKRINDAYQALTKDRQSYDAEYAMHYKHHQRHDNLSGSSGFDASSFTQAFHQFSDSSNQDMYGYRWGQEWEQPKSSQKQSHKSKRPTNNFDVRFYWNDQDRSRHPSNSEYLKHLRHAENPKATWKRRQDQMFFAEEDDFAHHADDDDDEEIVSPKKQKRSAARATRVRHSLIEA